MGTIKKNSLKAWFLASRPKTLTSAAVPVMIGLALSWKDSSMYAGDVFSFKAGILCLLFAFIMQIDANFINDFVDYAKGTDDIETRLGPERACAQGWVSTDMMKHAIALTTCLACIVGLPLIYYGGLEMILIGILCVVFCFLYTTHFSYMGLGDILVLVFFGIVPVCITYYIQLHNVTVEVFLASLACGIVIDALLMVNNFRDRDTDKAAGKNTIVVRIGAKGALAAYLLIGIVACAIGGVFLSNGRMWAFVLPFAYLLLHITTFFKMKRIWKGRELNRCLGEAARNIFMYGLLVTTGIMLS